MRHIIGIMAITLATIFIPKAATADVIGIWETVEGKSHVEITSCGGDKFCGKIIWLKEPNDEKGKPKVDINNQDEKLRSRPIIGINLLNGLEKTGEQEWDDGSIYNPEDGNTYSSEMRLKGADILEVEGCVLFICKKQIWNRVKQ